MLDWIQGSRSVKSCNERTLLHLECLLGLLAVYGSFLWSNVQIFRRIFRAGSVPNILKNTSRYAVGCYRYKYLSQGRI